MVKFYNPFKWHIIHYDGYYYVRRLFFLYWEYADKHQPLKFTWSDMRSYTKIFSLAEALEILKIKRNPPKVEVIHGIPD